MGQKITQAGTHRHPASPSYPSARRGHEQRNDPLEQRILVVLNDEIGTEVFMQALHTAQVFMPAADATRIRNFPRADKVEPLLADVEDDSKVLILFSSPDRGQSFLADLPDCKSGLLVEFEWILRNRRGIRHRHLPRLGPGCRPGTPNGAAPELEGPGGTEIGRCFPPHPSCPRAWQVAEACAEARHARIGLFMLSCRKRQGAAL